MNREGLNYTEKDVDVPEYEVEFDAIAEKTESDSLPIMLIGNQVFIPETSFSTIDEAIELAKKFS